MAGSGGASQGVEAAAAGSVSVEPPVSSSSTPGARLGQNIGHWLLAISFIILAVTGLNLLYGREFLIPLFGKEVFAALAYWGKLSHNYVGFAFMLGLVMILVMWVRHNIPHPRDAIWLLKGGGFFKTHVSAGRFNMGEKTWFSRSAGALLRPVWA